MGDPPARPVASVDVVVPVYNEARVLARSIERLRGYLEDGFPFRWRIVIADNGSTDTTLDIARGLAASCDAVDGERVGEGHGSITVLDIGERGKGLAVRTAWMRSTADVVAYTDADLSTGLTGLLPLVAPLVSGHSDLAIGSRLSEGSVVARGPKREIISRLYNLLLRVLFAVRFRDAQCGFKAMRTDVARLVLPAVQDDEWFFDSELLLLAEHNGLRIHEVPVDWVDDPDSRVDVRSTALADLRGVRRVLWTFMRGGGRVELGSLERKPLVDDFGRQTVSFVAIGIVSTLIALGVFVALRNEIGAVWANVVAFTVTTVGNIWANRRWTFRRRGADRRGWQIGAALAVYLVTLALSTVGLILVRGNDRAEIAMLLVTWGLAGLFRFTVLRSWVYRRSGGGRG